jgi:sigma-B regulation protein RsbU (phosphoserine phosphatase)
MAGKASARPIAGHADPQPRHRAVAKSSWLTSNRAQEVLCMLPAILSPIVTALAQHALWPMIRPFAWFLFYPSVLLGSWISGVSGGIAATLLSTLLVWWSFVPPEHTLLKDDPRYLMPALVFLIVGVLISFVQGRLKKTTVQVVKALNDTRNAERSLTQINRANRALSRCNQALIRAVDEDRLLTQVCDVVVQDAGYPFCWVGRALNDAAKTVKVVAESGRNSNYADSPGVTWADDPLGRGPTGTSIRTRKAVIARNILASPEMAPWHEQAQRHGYASSIAIPLLTDGDVFGALSIYASEPDAFLPGEVKLLTELAEDLAFGIAALRTKAQHAKAEEELRTLNAELEQRVTARTRELQRAREYEFEIGSRIQQNLLLDHLPAHIPGVSVAALTLPTQRIDGDFIIFTEPRGRTFDVIVGDVMGKGVPAALLGAATKSHLLKAIGQLSASSPPDELPKPENIVMRMHADIAHQLIELESFVTLSYVRIDPLRSVVQLVDCGHTGMIHLHEKTGKTDLLRGDNLPLGVREEELYEQKSFALERGDSLFLFSDGITEARNSYGEVFGSERLRECIEAKRLLEPAAMVEAIHLAVIAYCGSEHLADDVTFVAVCVEEIGPPMAKSVMTIGSNLCELSQARVFIRSFYEKLPSGLLSEDSAGALELAVDEATSNIIKHAYHGRPDRWIHIEAEAFPGRVVIRLHHRGSPYSAKPVSPPLVDTLRESGLGLYLLSQCVDDVQYFQDEQGGNCICLTKRTDKNAGYERETLWTSRLNARKA